MVAELGLNHRLRSTGRVRQRPVADGLTVAEASYRNSGGLNPHVGASAGVVLPLAGRQEIQLSAVYQQILPSNLHIWGLRAAYIFFRQ
ncbi:hypothetical protein D0N36_15955 [Hymenobacter lapidiphilus]|uniref:hypothetical protein n=1 Tax=Hymenobacter sp. CCM 8763 TaxID=2303334 RepID=UPI000E34E925|nr:hypothetical protein [Hymenobacter sp. CCM 8763]RFP64107.1 hypothetical protein D0N36_15955 [Hymenobacter sp. CCM 8763]